MAPKGDQLTMLTQLIQQNEQEYSEKLKATQTEITKNRLKTIASGMSKAQLKKQEKAAQVAWQATNAPKDSMQLENALMYF
jgi:ppGpp synthetase/RelA/SpoT-type nucleotidyltranferase